MFIRRLVSTWKIPVFLAAFITSVFYCFPSTKFIFPPRYVTNSSIKYILYWTIIGDNRNFFFPYNGSELFRNCSFSNCYATSDRSIVPIDEYAAILFYSPVLRGQRNEDVPERRSHHQRYINILYVDIKSVYFLKQLSFLLCVYMPEAFATDFKYTKTGAIW